MARVTTQPSYGSGGVSARDAINYAKRKRRKKRPKKKRVPKPGQPGFNPSGIPGAGPDQPF